MATHRETIEETLAYWDQNLDDILQMFHYDFRGRISVVAEPEPLDLTDCFRNSNGELQRIHGFGRYNVVHGYVAKGGPFVEKYWISVYGAYTIPQKLYDDVLPFMAISTFNKHSTSLYEVLGPLRDPYTQYPDIRLKENEEVHGFRQGNIYKILQKVQGRSDADLKWAERNSLFMIAGSDEGIVKSKIALDAWWLEQILEYGSEARTLMSEEEATLLEKVAGEESLLWALDNVRPTKRVQRLNYGSMLYPVEANWESLPWVFSKLRGYAKQREQHGALIYRGRHYPLAPEEIGKIVTPTKEILARTPVPRRVEKKPHPPY
jgi:hypothetical protein